MFNLSITLIIVALNIGIMAMWLFCTTINKQQGHSYYNVGNYLYASSYIPLLCRYLYTYLCSNPEMAVILRINYIVTILQFCGVGYFVMAYFIYNSKTPKVK